MLVQILLAVAGLLVLTFAADHLVLGSSRLAERIRISPVVVGVVVIGLGTSAPEFLVSGVAAAHGDTGLAVGNIAGSNILNLTLTLGIAALAGPIAVTSQVIRREVPLAVGAVILFSLLAWVGLSPLTGALLAVTGVAAVVVLLRWAGHSRSNDEIATDATELAQTTANLDIPVPPRRGCRHGSNQSARSSASQESSPAPSCWSRTPPRSPPISAYHRSSSGSPSSRSAPRSPSWSPRSRPNGAENPTSSSATSSAATCSTASSAAPSSDSPPAQQPPDEPPSP